MTRNLLHRRTWIAMLLAAPAVLGGCSVGAHVGIGGNSGSTSYSVGASVGAQIDEHYRPPAYSQATEP